MVDEQERDLGLELDSDVEADVEEPGDEGEVPDPGGGRSGTLGFIAGLVLGALVGAGVALLVAPERGRVTRKRLKRLVRRVKGDARERLDDWRDDVKQEVARRRREIRERVER